MLADAMAGSADGDRADAAPEDLTISVCTGWAALAAYTYTAMTQNHRSRIGCSEGWMLTLCENAGGLFWSGEGAPPAWSDEVLKYGSSGTDATVACLPCQAEGKAVPGEESSVKG